MFYPVTLRALSVGVAMMSAGLAQTTPAPSQPAPVQTPAPNPTPAPAPVQTPAPAAPRVIPISQAGFILDPLIFEGHPELLNDAQKAGLIQATAAGFPAALARKYPQSHISAPDDPAAVHLQAVAVVPPNLLPFENVTFRLDLHPPQGGTYSFQRQFNLFQLWTAQAGALNLAWDGVLATLPPQ